MQGDKDSRITISFSQSVLRYKKKLINMHVYHKEAVHKTNYNDVIEHKRMLFLYHEQALGGKVDLKILNKKRTRNSYFVKRGNICSFFFPVATFCVSDLKTHSQKNLKQYLNTFPYKTTFYLSQCFGLFELYQVRFLSSQKLCPQAMPVGS